MNVQVLGLIASKDWNHVHVFQAAFKEILWYVLPFDQN